MSRYDIGFSCDDNELQVFYRDKNDVKQKAIGPASKSLVAEQLIQLIETVRQL